MDLAAGVTVKEGGRVRRGPKRVRTLIYWYSLLQLKIYRKTPPTFQKKKKPQKINLLFIYILNESFNKQLELDIPVLFYMCKKYSAII